MKFNELITEKGSGIETWPVSNMLGHVKKFRKIDGWWEKPVEVKKWMSSHEIPEPKVRSSATLQKAIAKYGDIDPKMALSWYKDDLEDEKEERRAAKEKKDNRPTDDQIVEQGEDAIGQSFPDGDPIDQFGPWLRKHGLDMSDADAAFKKRHKKGFYAYLAAMWDSHAADALHDAKAGGYGEHYDDQWFAQGNPWK